MKSKFLNLLVGTTLICSVVLFTACSGSKTSTEISKSSTNNVQTATQQESKKNEPTQKELNDKLKKEAVKADFVQLNGHENENKGKKVFLEGEVTAVSKSGAVAGEFTVGAKENNGFGMYGITSLDTENNYEIGKDIKKGDKVKIYGVLDGKDQFGEPHIVATIIDK